MEIPSESPTSTTASTKKRSTRHTPEAIAYVFAERYRGRPVEEILVACQQRFADYPLKWQLSSVNYITKEFRNSIYDPTGPNHDVKGIRAAIQIYQAKKLHRRAVKAKENHDLTVSGENLQRAMRNSPTIASSPPQYATSQGEDVARGSESSCLSPSPSSKHARQVQSPYSDFVHKQNTESTMVGSSHQPPSSLYSCLYMSNGRSYTLEEVHYAVAMAKQETIRQHGANCFALPIAVDALYKSCEYLLLRNRLIGTRMVNAGSGNDMSKQEADLAVANTTQPSTLKSKYHLAGAGDIPSPGQRRKLGVDSVQYLPVDMTRHESEPEHELLQKSVPRTSPHRATTPMAATTTATKSQRLIRIQPCFAQSLPDTPAGQVYTDDVQRIASSYRLDPHGRVASDEATLNTLFFS